MHDFRDALRHITHRPGHAAAVAIILALGIGANALAFSVVHSVLLEPLPFPEPAKLVTVWQTQPGNSTRSVAPANFLDWRQASSFEGLAAYNWRTRTLGADEPERITTAIVSSNFFLLLRVQAIAGRTFQAPVDQGPRAVILREDLWRRRFGADPSIVGQSIRLDQETLIVAGVIATASGFPEDAEAWMQARDDVPELSSVSGDVRTIRDARYFRVLGRLRPGVTRAQAQSEMDAIASRLRDTYPDANADTGINVVDLHDQLTGGSAQTLWALFAVVACVLAIACGNVATLLLARALGRAQELRIRVALGASRVRLVRQLLTESLLLALGGAVLGLGLACVLRPVFVASLPSGIPRLASVSIDSTVVVFSLLAAVVTTLLFGLLPGVLGARTAELVQLRDDGRGGTSRRTGSVASVLMVAQLALAVVLLTGTGLMLRTVSRLYQRNPGLDVERLLALDVTIPDARAKGRSASVSDVQRMTDRIGALPGVTAVGAIQALPLAARGPSANIRVAGRIFAANEAPDVSWRTVTPGYFAAVGTPILRGRAFTEADREGAPPVGIINATLAHMLWGAADPLGSRIGTGLDGDGAPVVVVGVVADVPQEGIAAPVRPEMYRPLAQPSRFGVDAISIVVRTDDDPAHLGTASRAAIREVHPQAPVSSIRPMRTVAAAGVARELTATRGLALFGGLALILASVGLYGVTSRLVNDRKRELGVRMALGAEPRSLGVLVLRRTLKTAASGLVLGSGASLLLSRQLGALLHGSGVFDPVVVAGSSIVLLAASLVAAYLPARTASRVDPLIVMKE